MWLQIRRDGVNAAKSRASVDEVACSNYSVDLPPTTCFEAMIPPMTHPFALTVVLPSGQCITLAVEKSHYIMWVVEKVDREFDLRCTKYRLVRNGRPLTFYDDTKLKDVGIDGPDVLYVEIEGPCPPRVYPWERFCDVEM